MGQNMLENNLIVPDYESAAKILRKYKNRYEGKRCFIIGNGPSLKAEDLDKIKDEFSIASNRIFHIFKDTEWRPNVYTTMDQSGVNGILAEIDAIKADLKIIPVEKGEKMYPVENALPVPSSIEGFIWMLKGDMPSFSEDITECIYNGRTVTYANLQIAAYLGFREIILLGVDHSYSKVWHIPKIFRGYSMEQIREALKEGMNVTWELRDAASGQTQDHFCANYMDGAENTGSGFFIEEAVSAYKAAKKYAEEHGIHIVNATRGGKLGVFKRVNFDSLFRARMD